jgi:hypothetical protein
VAVVKRLPVHIVNIVFSKIIRYRAVMITYIRAIRSTFFGVVPVSSIGYVVGIAWLGAVAVTVRVRSKVEAKSFEIHSSVISAVWRP